MSYALSTLNTLPTEDAYGQYIQQSNNIAVKSQKKGNHPFGAVFVVDGKVFLEAENTVNTDKNHTRHAEMNLVDMIYSKTLTASQLRNGIVAASTEPCTMCTTALLNAGVKHIVYGCSASELSKIAPWDGYIDISIREVVARCILGNTVKVHGPILEAEALAIHQGYWPKLNLSVQNN